MNETKFESVLKWFHRKILEPTGWEDYAFEPRIVTFTEAFGYWLSEEERLWLSVYCSAHLHHYHPTIRFSTHLTNTEGRSVNIRIYYRRREPKHFSFDHKMTAEAQFRSLLTLNCTDEEAMLFLEHRDVDPNWSPGGKNYTLLQLTARLPNTFARLMQCKGADPNAFDHHGLTIGYWVCVFPCLPVLRRLLDDPRTDTCKVYAASPTTMLDVAINCNNVSAAELLLAHMRRLPSLVKYDSRIFANAMNNLISDLKDEMGRYITIKELREKHDLKWVGPLQLFLFGVLLSDGYYTLKRDKSVSYRFLRMMENLPMELQMILCNRGFDSPLNDIRVKDIEWGLKIFITDQWLS